MECRSIKSNSAAISGRFLEGIAIRYDSLSQDLGGFREIVKPRAAKDSIASRDIQFLYQHNDDYLLGRTASGTLKLSDQIDGLHFSLLLPDTTVGRDIKTLIGRGDLKGMSFSFAVDRSQQNAETWENRNGQKVRLLNRIILYEISVVGSPAYQSTSVGLRNDPVGFYQSAIKDLRQRLDYLNGKRCPDFAATLADPFGHKRRKLWLLQLEL